MTKLISLTIDGVTVEVPEGTLVVDAARKAGVNIPVFCYHPKMEPVGMCRMCLVEIGRPVIDRQSGQMLLNEDGSPQISFSPKLETACTTPVSQGMVVLGLSDKAKAGREDILEFLLTSHPLDCPICDKGGECPLQNLTMGFGPGQSRYLYEDKKHLAKNVPLGDLIVLDRERCIQCARCVRFQEVIAEDAVIGFYQRGRSLEIVTNSEPGFASYWSGNTTDICPVGALTTVDFRFGARPWELSSAASICNHCPVGCNLTFNIRREAASNGHWVVKRVMPRQNEMVNEIWICDKGRFGHHFADRSAPRLMHPLVRKGGELQPATWEEALETIAARFAARSGKLLTLAGGRLANEDLFNLQKLTQDLNGETALYTHMGGGEWTTRFGFPPGSNFGEMGAGNAILVVGCDLEESAPLLWLRVKQAAQRGATLIVLNSRSTKLDRRATHVLRYPFGGAVAAVMAFANQLLGLRLDVPSALDELVHAPEFRQAVEAFRQAKDAVVIYGCDGMGLRESEALAQACANLLVQSGHTHRPNNGLLAVWPRANDQGAWELGWRPKADVRAALESAELWYIVAADPAGDAPQYQSLFGGQKFVVVQELYLTQTARLADVVLPAQSWTEREGTYTSAERRVQRFYPAVPVEYSLPRLTESPGVSRSPLRTTSIERVTGPLPDYLIPAWIAQYLEKGKAAYAEEAASVFRMITSQVPAFAGLSYLRLAEVVAQWPIIARQDLYYGGTSYENRQGLGVTLPLPEPNASIELAWPQGADGMLPKLGMMAFPIDRLYDRGKTLLPSRLLEKRIGEAFVIINRHDAARLKVSEGQMVRVSFLDGEVGVVAQARLDAELPERVMLVPRSFDIPILAPAQVEVKPT